jgi:hypothetical protein
LRYRQAGVDPLTFTELCIALPAEDESSDVFRIFSVRSEFMQTRETCAGGSSRENHLTQNPQACGPSGLIVSRGSRRGANLRFLSNLSSSCEAGNVFSNSLPGYQLM